MIRGARRKSSYRRPFMMVLFIVGALSLGGYFWKNKPEQAQEVLADEVQEEVSVSVAPEDIIGEYDHSYTVQEGDTLSSVFAEQEIPFQEIFALEQVESDLFDFTDIQVGKTVYFSVLKEEADFKLAHVYYQPDVTRVIHAQQTSGGWVIEEKEIVYDRRESAVSGVVESSLYLSALKDGVDEAAILRFADMFAWDIDFALQTRNGDQYRFIYEEKYLHDKLVTTGKVLAGEYINNGNSFKAYYFDLGNGQIAYFDEEGNALQKAFLKAPVNYRYVTSGFSSARFHPVFGTVMPHNGVDYAAAYGTPIIAVADGIVSKMGWMGAYGNRIEIRHGDRYGSQYSHMSSFVAGMSVGDTINQGEVVGYVGSTGASTGNHVHFSITDRGSYVNPDKVDVPDGEPVPEEMREAFLQIVAERQAQLDQIQL